MSLVRAVRQSADRIVQDWTGFWFTPLDPLTLGVMRVLVGGMMIYAHFVWGLNLDGFFGSTGWQSTEAVNALFGDDWLPSLWWFVPDAQLRTVHLIGFLPLVLFMLGLFTPWTSVLALAVTVSNSNRAPLANYGMDQILVMLGLYLTIGGCGRAFSLDAWRRQRSGHQQLQRQPTSAARLGTRLIQVHFCVIYFFAGISKLQGEAWWNGEAVWMAFANQEYQSLDMTWLARYPWICQLATHSTVLWEISFPFLIWNRRLRPFVVLGGIGMHAGIGLCMGMITFGSIVIFGYLAFVPPDVMQRVLVKLRFLRATEGIESDLSVDQPDGSMSVRVEETIATIALCDPEWKHREFARYLLRRGYEPFVCVTPSRIWQHVEQNGLSGAFIFVDRLSTDEFRMLLGDLTLSPVSQLPVILATARDSRRTSIESAELPSTRVVMLPQSYRQLREELANALTVSDTHPEATLTEQMT